MTQNDLTVEGFRQSGLQWRRLMPSLVFVLTVAAVLPITGVIILLVGVNPIEAYLALVVGAFGSSRGLTETILQAVPLLLIALGLVLAFRCQVWNIGAEGQYLIGALSATWVGLAWGESLPSLVILPLMFIAGALGGGVWGAIPGILKAKRGLSEIVVSLMLNFVAFYGLAYLVRVPLKNPEYFLPHTAPLPEAARLLLLGGPRLHIGVIIALVAVGLVYFILWRTSLGYELRAVGANPTAAEAAGIHVSRSIVLAMVLSGMFAGVAGMIEVAGVHHFLSQDISIGYGFTAILIAILGQLNPFGVLLAAFFFASLQIGADYMQRAVQLQKALVGFIQATLVLFFLVGTVLAKRVGE